MKNYKFFALAVASMCIVTSACTDKADEVINQEQKTELQIFGNINNQTRAVNKSAWAAGDVIGLNLANSEGSVVRSDVQYKTESGDGTFTAVNEGEKLSISATDGQMTLTGYYPYNTEYVSNNTYTVNSWTSNNENAALDLIWGSTNCSSASSAVMISFRHQFTKVVLNVNVVSAAQNPFSTLTADSLVGMTVAADNMNFPVSVNLLTGAATLGAKNATALSVPMSANGTSGELIFAPGITEPNRSMSFNLPNNRKLIWHIDDSVIFEAGKAYKYNLTLSSTQMEVEATIQGEIIPWDEVNGGDFYITPE